MLLMNPVQPHLRQPREAADVSWRLNDQKMKLKLDELVKSRKTPFFVIPAKAGIQSF
jgi:hypothetical protein